MGVKKFIEENPIASTVLALGGAALVVCGVVSIVNRPTPESLAYDMKMRTLCHEHKMASLLQDTELKKASLEAFTHMDRNERAEMIQAYQIGNIVGISNDVLDAINSMEHTVDMLYREIRSQNG